MKMRILVLFLFAVYVVLSGKNQYIQCYKHLTEYYKIYMQIKDAQQDISRLSEQKQQYQETVSDDSLSWYENRNTLADEINSLPNCTITEVSALDINNKQSVLYLAKTDKIADINRFTDKINGIEFKLSVNDVQETLSALDKLNCIIYRICVDNVNKEVSAQILIIKEKN